MNTKFLELLASNNIDTTDAEKVIDFIVGKCKSIAVGHSRSTGFDTYDELNEYERGCDDTACSIAFKINDYFK